MNAAGSGALQCARAGCPGQTGQLSAAAWSHTVITLSIGGASGTGHEQHDLLRVVEDVPSTAVDPQQADAIAGLGSLVDAVGPDAPGLQQPALVARTGAVPRSEDPLQQATAAGSVRESAAPVEVSGAQQPTLACVASLNTGMEPRVW